MPHSTSEVIPCLSAVQCERNHLMRDDSELLHSDESRLESSLTPQSQDEHQTLQGSISHRTSQETVTEIRTSRNPTDDSFGIPRSLSFSWASFAADVFSVLVTIPFLVLGFLLVQAKGGMINRTALLNFENSIRVAATAFPFVFAAIFGRLTTQVARWKLERGGSLPSIEQWLGSRTLFSAFLTQVKLGGLNVIGVSMTIAWALSPLGAQSILRVLGTGSRDVRTNSSVTYFDTDTPSVFTALIGGTGNPDMADVPTMIDSLYAASLMSADSIKSSGQDLWGNIKIPYLFTHAGNISEDAWRSIPDDGSVEFSSLVGIPFAANIEPGLSLKSNFTIESSHIQLQCSPFVSAGGYIVDDHMLSSYANWSLTGSLSFPASCSWPAEEAPKNGTFQAFTHTGVAGGDLPPWILALDTFLDPLWLCQDGGVNSPSKFANETGIFASEAKLQLLAWTEFWRSPRGPLSTTCRVSQRWVESRVDCNWSTSPACVVKAQRPSQKQHASSNITHLSLPKVFRWLHAGLPGASGLMFQSGLPDASLIYLKNTSSSCILSQDGQIGSLDKLTDSDISVRLGQLINTYLMISQAYGTISIGALRWGYGNLASPTYNFTTAMWIVETEDIYTINNTWLGVFFVAATAMLIGSIVGAVFCHSSITPEILGFASAVIRNSKYVDLAPGFGALGGLEMTKAFEKIEFRYGVVNKSESGQEVLGVSWKVSAGRARSRVPYV